MKIGIITFHRAINYGALLQTYALHTALNRMNIENEVIDYRCKKIENEYWKIFKVRTVTNFFKVLLSYRVTKKKQEKFSNFIKNIKLSKDIYNTFSELIILNEKYDCFITGSDQVWNYKMTDMDEAYFLGFIKDINKKYSYAASIGLKTIPENFKPKYESLLNDFKRISIREQQGKEIIKNLLGRDSEVVLDPTFLLSKSEWEKVAMIPKEKDYILIYVMKNSESLFKFATKLSIKTDCKIKFITYGLKKPIKAEYITTAGIEDFIGLFINAKYIVTNSFHGTAFSIIMNKNFFLELQEPPASNDRLENIMDTYNLRDRQILNGENVNINKNIDYDYVNEQLNSEKYTSLKYLKNIIKDYIQ